MFPSKTYSRGGRSVVQTCGDSEACCAVGDERIESHFREVLASTQEQKEMGAAVTCAPVWVTDSSGAMGAVVQVPGA
jgi:hypothetical protein